MSQWNIRDYLPDLGQVSAWAAKDPRRAAEVVLELGSGPALRGSLKHVANAWAEADPREGLDFAATLPPGQRTALSRELVATWATRALSSAVEFTTGLENASLRASVAKGLALAWAKSDPESALSWSQEHLRGDARSEFIGDLVKSAAEKSIEGAGYLVAAMEPGSGRNQACASIFETWFGKGVEQRDAAFEWLSQLPDPDARRAALERVQGNWVWREPEAARDFINGRYGYLASDLMIHGVACAQASKDPEAAMKWASSLPADRAAKTRAAVLEQWVQVRPEGAFDYVLKLPSGAEREQAIENVTQYIAYQNPAQALSWLRKVPVADQHVVRSFLRTAGLPPERRRALEEELKGR